MQATKQDPISSKLESKESTAKVAREVADVSYRQINDWDSKNVLPKKERDKDSWRRFSGVDIIRLTIISKLVELGIPIQRQKKLIEWMNKPEAMSWLVKKISWGFSMFLVTDLEGNIGFDDESEAYDFVFLIGDEVDHPTVVLPLNKLIGDVAKKLGIKIPEVRNELKLAGQMKALIDKAEESKNKELVKSTEKKVIELIREKQYQTVVVKVKDGNIVHINREESIPVNQ